MTAKYTVVEYRPEFKGQIASLQRHLWSSDAALNLAYFEWKYERNPYFPAPRVVLGLHGDRLVGMRGLFGMCWEVGFNRAPIVLPCADDHVIAPKHRGSGLANEVMTLAHDIADREGFTHIVNISAGRMTALQSLAMGWRSGGTLDPAGWGVRRSSRRSRLSRRLRTLVGLRPALFAHLDRASGSRRGSTRGEIVLSTKPKPEAMARLVERIGHDGRIRHLRNVEYFRWRFQNPLRDYRFLFLGNEFLSGYLVLHRVLAPMSNPNRVRLSDWEATDTDGLRSLLRFALHHGQFEDLFAWEAALPPGGRQLLREHGFAPADLETTIRGLPCILVRAANRHEAGSAWMLGDHDVLNPASWDVRLLYSMIG